MNPAPAVERESEGACFVGSQAVIGSVCPRGSGDGYLFFADGLALGIGDVDVEGDDSQRLAGQNVSCLVPHRD